MTRRTYLKYWTEVKRIVVVDGEPHVKQTCCCCKDPGASRRDCMLRAGNKTPCRCFCHDTKRLK